MSANKKILFRNIALTVLIVLIFSALIIFTVSVSHKEEALPVQTPDIITGEEHILDSLGHPELSDGGEWKETSSDNNYLLERVGYSPSGTLSCGLYNGGTLTIGGVTCDSGICLNPLYVAPDDSLSSQYGIYVRASDGNIFYSDVLGSAEYSSNQCFIITDRTYDTLIPYDAGTYWNKDAELLSQTECEIPVSISFRVIRFSDYTVVGTASADVVWEDGTFTLCNLRNTDVSSSGEYDYSERREIISKAFNYISDPGTGPAFTSFNSEYENIIYSMATVEKCKRPYFQRLMDSYGNVISAGSLSGNDITAVNIPYPGTGNITVYLSPASQVQGYRVSETFFDRGESLTAFAYDFLYPFSAETLLDPTKDAG